MTTTTTTAAFDAALNALADARSAFDALNTAAFAAALSDDALNALADAFAAFDALNTAARAAFDALNTAAFDAFDSLNTALARDALNAASVAFDAARDALGVSE